MVRPMDLAGPAHPRESRPAGRGEDDGRVLPPADQPSRGPIPGHQAAEAARSPAAGTPDEHPGARARGGKRAAVKAAIRRVLARADRVGTRGGRARDGAHHQERQRGTDQSRERRPPSTHRPPPIGHARSSPEDSKIRPPPPEGAGQSKRGAAGRLGERDPAGSARFRKERDVRAREEPDRDGTATGVPRSPAPQPWISQPSVARAASMTTSANAGCGWMERATSGKPPSRSWAFTSSWIRSAALTDRMCPPSSSP